MCADTAQFGNPDFWQQAHDSFPKFWGAISRVTDALNNVTMRRYDNVEPSQKIILNLGMLTGVSAMELITLVGNGFGLGAMKIARTILETTINAEYLRVFPEECENYLEWHWVEQHKLLEYMREHMQESLNELDPETVARTDQEIGRVRFRYARVDGGLIGSWCRRDLGARAAKTGFQEAYKLIYPMGSKLIHGTFGALAMHFDVDGDECRIALPPSLKYCAQALVGAHMCLLRIVDTVSKVFNVNPFPPLAELIADYEDAWRNYQSD